MAHYLRPVQGSMAMAIATAIAMVVSTSGTGGAITPILADCHRRLALYLQILTWQHILLAYTLGATIYVVALVTYRIYFSPIAAFPGPFLARATHWYEFYHNFVRTGMYYQEIRKMHDKYGPVVRVTPEEIHILEPSAYHHLFVTGAVRKSDSYRRFSNGTGFEDMTAISTAHDAHRRLRVPLDKLFSRSGILSIEPRLIERTERLCNRLKSFQGTGRIVNLTDALSSLTTDVISSIIFEEPSDYLGDPDFNHEWYETLKMGTLSVPLFKHMPWAIGWVARPLIRSLVKRVTKWTIWDEKARRQVMLTRKRPSDEAVTRDKTTVLDHLVHSDLVEQEFGKSGFARLAQLIQQAGAHNVSHTLSTIVVHLLLDAKKVELLEKELDEAWSSYEDAQREPTWLELEKLPYLSACISEGLRMAIGGMNRTPRVFSHDEVQVCDWIIPKGTPISMSTYWMHYDAAVFTNPDDFNPSRWLDASSELLQAMRSRFVPFAKGSRTCVGQNLVYMQLFHTLARLFRPKSPKLALRDTTLRDIIAVHGLLFPMPPFDTTGVKVLVV